MKFVITTVLLVFALTGCAQSSQNVSSTPNNEGSDSSSYPVPAVVDNAVPKSCDLPELTTLLSEVAGAEVIVGENPVNSENSTEEDIQSYLAGRYLVCVYSESDPAKTTYVIWDESVGEEWLATMADANQDLEPGEGLFETVALGLGELEAFVLLEGDANSAVFTGHSFKDDVSVLVYSSALSDGDQGKALLSAAINSMP